MPTKATPAPPFDLQELLLKGIFKGFGDFIVMFWPYMLIIIAIAVIKWKIEGKAERAAAEKRIRRDEEIREKVREERRSARR